MLPARFAPVLFGFIVSGLMSFMVSGIATLRAIGAVEDFGGFWMGAWLPSWAVAFPTILVVAPLARKLVARIASAT